MDREGIILKIGSILPIVAMQIILSAAVLVTTFLVIYLPDLGHGFIQDDFDWIRSGRTSDLQQLIALFSSNVGFYRPIVSTTFAADYAIWGLDPFGYGLTNLALAIADALLIFALARRFALPNSAALLTAALWAFNFHGVNMALLWVSGRTALLVIMFSLATADAVLRGWRVTAGFLGLAAMLCKEEAALLPVLFVAFVAFDQPRIAWSARVRRAISLNWPLLAALAVYLMLRLQSGAFDPTDAPSYYRFSLSPALVLRNIAEYTDRAGTVPLVAILIMLFATGWTLPPLSEDERRAIRFGAAWIAATYALTVFLPIRSSLYALMPSVGSVLVAGAVGSRAARVSPRRFARAAVALLMIALLLVPVYRSRNRRWVELADLSSRALQTMQISITPFPSGSHIVLIDNPGERVNLDGAFGSLLPDALALFAAGSWTGEIVTPGVGLPSNATVVLRLKEGRLVPLDARARLDRNQ